jgi:hypothetical protein
MADTVLLIPNPWGPPGSPNPLPIKMVDNGDGSYAIGMTLVKNPTAPAFSSAEIGTVNATTVAVTFNTNMAAVGNDFKTGVTIKVNNSPVVISTATRQTDRTKVYYVIPAVIAYDTVTWEYTSTTGHLESDANSEPLDTVSAQSVANNVPIVTPHFSAAEIGVVNATTVAVTFDVNVNAAGSDFKTGVTINVNAAPVVIATGTRQTNHAIVYYVIPAADANDVVTWAYNAGTGHIVSEADGTVLASVTAQAVTNTIPGVPPTFSSAEVGTVDATTVAVTFDMNVAAAGSDFKTGVTIEVNAAPVAIGTVTRQTNHAIVYYAVPAVISTDTVTWAYNGATGHIANEADGTAMADVTAQAVTNNVSP